MSYDDQFIMELRKLANLPQKKQTGMKDTCTRGSQTLHTYVDPLSCEQSLLSEATCEVEASESLPCFRQYLLFTALWLNGMQVPPGLEDNHVNSAMVPVHCISVVRSAENDVYVKYEVIVLLPLYCSLHGTA